MSLDFPLVNSYVVGVHYDEPTKVAATGAVAGTPGTYTPAGAEVPEDLGELAGVVATPATAWTTGQYVNLLDGSVASWNGIAWAEGTATELGDPGNATVAEVQAYVEEHPDRAEAVLEAETAGKNRSTLVNWLEERLG